MLIRNGMVYRPDFRFRWGDVRVKDGRIEEVSNTPLMPEKEEAIIDATGRLVIPGLTDIHFHGCVGFDTNDATHEALSAMAEYEAGCGITTICPATMTLPEERIGQIVKTAYRHKKRSSVEADLVGVNLEGPFIALGRVGAQNPAYVHEPDVEFLRNLLLETEHFPRLITIAPEVKGAIACIRALHDDIRFSIGHTEATYEEARKGFEAGARHLTHMYNAMPGIHHRAPGPIAAAAEQPEVTCEIISDGVHIHPAAVRAAFFLMGPEKMILISDSTRATGKPDGEYELGGQPIFKHDHAAFLKDGTLAGSTTNVYDCMVNAISFGIPVEDAVRAATYNPAKAIGILPQYGTIEAGKRAKLLVIDPSKNMRLERVINE